MLTHPFVLLTTFSPSLFHPILSTFQSITDAGRRLSHISLANTHVAVNQPWQALHHAHEATKEPVQMSPTLVDILALGNAGLVEIMIGSYEKARESFHQGIAYTKLLGAIHFEAWLSMRQATCALWRGDVKEAAFWANEAWLLSHTAKDGRTQLEAAIEEVHIAGEAGDIVEADAWYKRAHKLADEHTLTRYRGRMALLRAYLAARYGDRESALASIQECMGEIDDGGAERLRLPALALFVYLDAGSSTVVREALQRERDAQDTLTHSAPNGASGTRFARATPYRRWLAAGASHDALTLSWVW